MKKFFDLLPAVILIGVLFFSGCEVFQEALQESYASEDPSSDEYETRFNIGVFQIINYPRASNLEKEIDIGNGETICINTNALFHSKRIRAARAIPRPGNPDVYDLEFRLDRMGKTQWMMLHGSNRGREVAMMVDNRFAGTFVPASLDDGAKDWVKLRIGVDVYTAKGIVKFARKNYDYYNPEAKSWFSNL